MEKYINNFENITGSFWIDFVEIISFIDEYQKEKEIKGNVGEIGVYHGKSFIPLLNCCREDEIAIAIDCFDDIQYNYDNSGLGDKNIMIDNVNTFSDFSIDKVHIVQADSTKMTPEDLMQGKGKYRIFSVDGAHTSDATYIDFKNSLESLVDGGVIIMDDYFNQEWPAVSEGVNRLTLREDNDIKMVFVGYNKTIFCNKKYYKEYFKLLDSRINRENRIIKYAKLCGSKTIVAFHKPNYITVRERLQDINWYHSINLGNNTITPGSVTGDFRNENTIRMPEDLRGKRVLDVGCLDGYFSFAAERRGASVVALDKWKVVNPAGFNLARKMLNSSVVPSKMDLMDISKETIGTYDVVLCLSVLHHLKHPLYALERLYDVCDDLLILETHTTSNDLSEPNLRFYPEAELGNDPSNWFSPNVSALRGMLTTVGFKGVEIINKTSDGPEATVTIHAHKKPTKQFTFRDGTFDEGIYHDVVLHNEYNLPESFGPEDVIIDIGTHIGCFTHACLERGAQKMVCFEALRENFNLATGNLEYGGERKSLYNKAVWRSDKPDTEILFSYVPNTEGLINTGGGSFLNGNGDIPVKTISLDSILENHENVRLLKLDCEGSEFPILLTSTKLDKVQEIIGEFHDYGTEYAKDILIPEEAVVRDAKSYTGDDIKVYLEPLGFEVEVTRTTYPDGTPTRLGKFHAIRK